MSAKCVQYALPMAALGAAFAWALASQVLSRVHASRAPSHLKHTRTALHWCIGHKAAQAVLQQEFYMYFKKHRLHDRDDEAYAPNYWPYADWPCALREQRIENKRRRICGAPIDMSLLTYTVDTKHGPHITQMCVANNFYGAAQLCDVVHRLFGTPNYNQWIQRDFVGPNARLLYVADSAATARHVSAHLRYKLGNDAVFVHQMSDHAWNISVKSEMLVFTFNNDTATETTPLLQQTSTSANTTSLTISHSAPAQQFDAHIDRDCRLQLKQGNLLYDPDYSFYGYKVAKTVDTAEPVIIKLGIYKKSRVAGTLDKKLRTDHARVIAIGRLVIDRDRRTRSLVFDVDTATSSVYATGFLYRVGYDVRERGFHSDLRAVCKKGIHFVMFTEQVLEYVSHSRAHQAYYPVVNMVEIEHIHYVQPEQYLADWLRGRLAHWFGPRAEGRYAYDEEWEAAMVIQRAWRLHTVRMRGRFWRSM